MVYNPSFPDFGGVGCDGGCRPRMILSFETDGRGDDRGDVAAFEALRLGNDGNGRCFECEISLSFGLLSAHPMLAAARRRLEYQVPSLLPFQRSRCTPYLIKYKTVFVVL